MTTEATLRKPMHHLGQNFVNNKVKYKITSKLLRKINYNF